jgi:hypothetical protein
MMGHRGKLRGAGEHEALTKAKRYLTWRAGMRKVIKRAFNKRQRAATRWVWDQAPTQAAVEHPAGRDGTE